MKKTLQSYRDLEGREHALQGLSKAELSLIRRLKERFDQHPDWNEFDNFWMNEVAVLYKTSGLTRPQMRQTAVYRIAQDLSGRLAIAQGLAEPPDYRDELDELIRTRFPTRHAFCQATGLADDMLSHVLAKRKQLSIDALATALARIGYTLKIMPRESKSVELPTAL
jgi:hypothetical protein